MRIAPTPFYIVLDGYVAVMDLNTDQWGLIDWEGPCGMEMNIRIIYNAGDFFTSWMTS
jgi:hypothetical protein